MTFYNDAYEPKHTGIVMISVCFNSLYSTLNVIQQILRVKVIDFWMKNIIELFRFHKNFIDLKKYLAENCVLLYNNLYF